jgi:flagellar operon protein (TIGR03826 family)
MALANCPQCGRLFNKALREICPECMRLEDEQFYKVRDYLRKHRNAKPMEVSEATEVPVQTIYKFVREGRLMAKYYDGLYYECEKCGKPIVSGKYCKDCTDEITRNVKQLQEAVSPDSNEKNESWYRYHYNFLSKDKR